MEANVKRYTKEFGTSMAVYAVTVPLSVWLLKGHEHSLWLYLIAGLPIVPSAFAMWAAVRFFRSLDELQRRIQFEGLAFSFMATCLLTLTWGFLQNAGLPKADVIWVAPMSIMLWGLGLCVAERRYK